MTTAVKKHPGFVIAGTHSSVGKTSTTLGLLRLLRNMKLPVKPFKAGPDYIDPGHHRQAAGIPSYNLDSWMCPRPYLKKLFADIMQPGSLAVVEGVMGLFDGAYPTRDKGTTADIAKLFDLPVVLVIDGSQMARSAAALVNGFAKFDSKLKFLGVIANRVTSQRHAGLIEAALKHHTDVPLLGHLPVKPSLTINERHLGLHQSLEQADQRYNDWAQHIKDHVDINSLLRKAGYKKLKVTPSASSPRRWPQNKTQPFKIGIARDAAFQFCYQDTLDLIQHHSGSVHFFSPMKDRKLPDDLDWLYFPGGYPELFADKLSANKPLIKEIKKFALKRGILAECGGLMYTGKTVTDSGGKKHSMLGLFDFSTSIQPPKMTLGYRELEPASPVFGGGSFKVKGHEFHFSNFKHNRESTQFKQAARKNRAQVTDGYLKRRMLAFYSHVYWGASHRAFQSLLKHLIES